MIMEVTQIKQKMKKINILMIIWVFLLMGIVQAIGVMPGNQPFEFDPDSKYEGRVLIRNTAGEMRVRVSASGELAPYMHLEVSEIILKEGESREVKYNVALPKNAEPRVYRGQIVVAEVPEEEGIPNRIIAGVSVASGVEIFLQPVENYLVVQEYKIDVQNRDVTFVIPVVNKGFLEMSEVSAEIQVNDEKGNKIDVLKTNTVTLPPNGNKELVLQWNADMPPGIYAAIFTPMVGEERKASEEREFFFRSQEILEVKDIIPDENFIFGSHARFKIILQNHAGRLLEGAFIGVEVYDKEGTRVAQTETPRRDISAFEEVVQEVFFDTLPLQKGSYKVLVKVHHSGMVHEVEMKTTLRGKSMKSTVLSGMAALETGGKQKRTVFLWILGIILLINGIWLIKRKRGRKERIFSNEKDGFQNTKEDFQDAKGI